MENIEDQLYDDDLDVIDIIEHDFPRNQWERVNYYQTMDEYNFFKRFRLTKPTVAEVLEEIEDQLSYDNQINNPISPMNQLLLTLRYYASNGHQISIGDFIGCSQPTASRIISKVSRAIAGTRPLHIFMPQTNQQKLQTQEKFYRMSRFPRVIGVIDCTHVKIQSPGGDDAEVYRNRKDYFSINTQLVVNSELEIMDIVARWPGSVHDSTIFNNSRILGRFENNEFGDGLLLGDSGYALRKFLFTPLLNPQTRGEHLYNEAHKRTRNVVERVNGIIKRRFPVLAYGMRCSIENILPIIVATGVLHNRAQRMGEGLPPDPDEIDMNILEYLIEQGDIPPMPAENHDQNLVNHRRIIIDQFFNILE